MVFADVAYFAASELDAAVREKGTSTAVINEYFLDKDRLCDYFHVKLTGHPCQRHSQNNDHLY